MLVLQDIWRMYKTYSCRSSLPLTFDLSWYLLPLQPPYCRAANLCLTQKPINKTSSGLAWAGHSSSFIHHHPHQCWSLLRERWRPQHHTQWLQEGYQHPRNSSSQFPTTEWGSPGLFQTFLLASSSARLILGSYVITPMKQEVGIPEYSEIFCWYPRW